MQLAVCRRPGDFTCCVAAMIASQHNNTYSHLPLLHDALATLDYIYAAGGPVRHELGPLLQGAVGLCQLGYSSRRLYIMYSYHTLDPK